MEKNNEKKQSGMKLTVLFTLAAVAILAAIVVFTNQQQGDLPVETSEVDITEQPTFGESEAPVTVVEFGDFKCPSCKAWGETVYPQLVADYIETGDVKFSYLNVLFHGNESMIGSLAAEAVYEQSPDAYWDFHKALFAEQPAVENHDAPWLTQEKTVEVASQFPAIDLEQLMEDMEKQTTMDKVKADEALVEEHGVAMTPTIVVNGQTLEDPFDYDTIKALIDEALAEEN